MNRSETIQHLRMAHDEVVALRRRVAELAPKADAYDTIQRIAALSVHPSSQGYGEDVAWRLKTAIDALVAEREKEHRAPVESS